MAEKEQQTWFSPMGPAVPLPKSSNPFEIQQEIPTYKLMDMIFRPDEYALQRQRNDRKAKDTQADVNARAASNNLTIDDMSKMPNLGWKDPSKATAPAAGSQAARAPLKDRIIRQESGGRNGVEGPMTRYGTRAQGLMQVMPATAREVARELRIPFDPQKLRTDPEYNMKIGDAYLAKLNKMFNGNELLVSAAYNAGPGTVQRWLKPKEQGGLGNPLNGEISEEDWARKIPYKETRNYVKNVVFDGKIPNQLSYAPSGTFAPNAAAYAAPQLSSVDPALAKSRPKPQKGKYLDLPDAPQQERLGDAPQMALRNLEEELGLMAALQPRQKTGYDHLTSALAQAAAAAAQAQGQSLGALIASAGGAFGGTYQGSQAASEAEQQKFLMGLLNERLSGEQANREIADMNAVRTDARNVENTGIDFNNARGQFEVDSQQAITNLGVDNSYTDALNTYGNQVFSDILGLTRDQVGTQNQQAMLGSELARALDQARVSGQSQQFNADSAVTQFNIAQVQREEEFARQDAVRYREMYKGMEPAAVALAQRAGLPVQMQMGSAAEDYQIRLAAQQMATGNVPIDVILAAAMNEPGFKMPPATAMVFGWQKGATPEELMANRLEVLKKYVVNSGDPDALPRMVAGVKSENPILKLYKAQ
jgi:soluble lytic murein transglycosylase-like protein